MSPLHIFLSIAKVMAAKPMHFWPIEEQKKLPREVIEAIFKLKQSLEIKDLQDTIAYNILVHLENSVTETEVNELPFIQALANLVEVYKQAPIDEGLQELLVELQRVVNIAKQRVLEYHIALESVRKKKIKMSTEEQVKSDQGIIRKVGIFYILEYTLQVLYEFSYLSDADKRKLLIEGLKTKAGNLPAYLPLEDTFRKELCLKLFDTELQDDLLHAFYNFEEVLYNYAKDIKVVGPALKLFNLALIKAFRGKGLVKFKAVAYAPFGNNLPIDELIKKIEEVHSN